MQQLCYTAHAQQYANVGLNVDDYRGRAGVEQVREHKCERVMSLGSATTQGQLKRHKVIQEKDEEAVKEVVLENGDAVPKQLQVPSKYWRVEDMTGTFLSHKALPTMEPVATSEANLKHLNAAWPVGVRAAHHVGSCRDDDWSAAAACAHR